jgi:predicted Fe-Mo cluster-binding NifX family protein
MVCAIYETVRSGSGSFTKKPKTERIIPMRQGKNEIAVCTFQNRICPRFDLSREILIYDNQAPEKGPVEKIDVSSLSPVESLNILIKKKVEVVIVGGMQERYQSMFLNNHIEVIWGVIGEATDATQAYIRGTLYPGIGRVPIPVMPKQK